MLDTRSVLAALAGPAVIGAIVGAPRGVFAVVHDLAAVPMVIVGVTILTIPALYITTAALGLAPPAAEVLAASGRALRACGIACLGLAAPLAFIIATASDSTTAWHRALGVLVLFVAILAGLRAFWMSLFHRTMRATEAGVVFLLWSFVAGGIGWSFLDKAVA